MDLKLVINIIYNTALLLALSLSYAIFEPRSIKMTKKSSLLMGFILGLLGIAIMINPHVLATGIVFDVRSVLIGVTAMFMGPVPVSVAAAVTIAFRVFSGGSGAVPGIIVIIISAVIGLLWHRFRFEKAVAEKSKRFIELYIVGVIIHLFMLAAMMVLPWQDAVMVLRSISLPVMLVYPVATAVLGMLLFKQIDRVNIRLQLEEREERLKVTLLSVGDGVISTDKDGVITLINKTAQDIAGCSNNVVGEPISAVLKLEHEETGEPVSDPVAKVIETGRTVGIANHTVLVCRDGTKKVIEDSAAPIKDDQGNLIGVVFVFRDVTEERKKQEQIKYLSYHDSLTGLYNRGFFDEELKRLDTHRNLPISIIIGDVNGLKLTNDAFGHDVGDELLREMARAIKKACRKEDIIARWGGDEFIILLPRTNEKSAERVCERIKSNCAKVKMSDVNFSISLGHETKASPEQQIEEVLKSAEQYMYRKKYLESSSLRGKTINTILTALHEKNPREQQHSVKVSEYCVKIAKAMGMTTREINQMELIGMMHDIGKIAISDRVLNKKGTLTAKEWSELKRHPEIGYRILSSSTDMAYIAEYVLKHHERMDGKGYPNGISGDKIPLESRIVAVADAYAAMTNERAYKEGMPETGAIEELRAKSGTQFDAEVVEIFIKKVLKPDYAAEPANAK